MSWKPVIDSVDSYKPSGKINLKVGQKLHGFFNPSEKLNYEDLQQLNVSLINDKIAK